MAKKPTTPKGASDQEADAQGNSDALERPLSAVLPEASRAAAVGGRHEAHAQMEALNHAIFTLRGRIAAAEPHLDGEALESLERLKAAL